MLCVTSTMTSAAERPALVICHTSCCRALDKGMVRTLRNPGTPALDKGLFETFRNVGTCVERANACLACHFVPDPLATRKLLAGKSLHN